MKIRAILDPVYIKKRDALIPQGIQAALKRSRVKGEYLSRHFLEWMQRESERLGLTEGMPKVKP